MRSLWDKSKCDADYTKNNLISGCGCIQFQPAEIQKYPHHLPHLVMDLLGFSANELNIL